MNRYRATFSRHRVALILPVVIAVLFSSWYAINRPHKYESFLTVWIDNPVPGTSSLFVQQNGPTPAAIAQETLQELLSTRQFVVDVAHDDHLASYFRNGTPASFGGKAFGLTVVGPQVLSISMTSTNPAYLPAALSAVAAQYVNQVTGTLKARDQASVEYDQAQVASASDAVQQADENVANYQESHPGETATDDVELSQLTQAGVQAQETYTSDLDTLGLAQVSLQNEAVPTAFHVIDAPTPPIRVSNKKHIIFTVVEGFAAGLVISIIALSALTASDKTARVPEDIETMLGMNVVGTIEEVRRGPLIAIPRRSGSK